MKKKQGISLIVLVITIIVMIILAASVVITLSNTGIIEKANNAVEVTSIKEIEQLASLAWAEEFMDGKRGEALKTAVLDKLKDYTDKYTITVTDTGVSVDSGSSKQLNEYGFYFDVPYQTEYESGIIITTVFKPEGIAETYVYYPEQQLYNMLVSKMPMTYEKGKIIGEDNAAVEVSADGKTITAPTDPNTKYVYTDTEYHDVYYNEKYYVGYNEYLVISPDNALTFYNLDGSVSERVDANRMVKTSHQLEETDGSSVNALSNGDASIKGRLYYQINVSLDGRTIMLNEDRLGTLMLDDEEAQCTLTCTHMDTPETITYRTGMTWREWINSSYNTLTTVDVMVNGEYLNCVCAWHNTKEQIGYTYNSTRMNLDDLMVPNEEFEIKHK